MARQKKILDDKQILKDLRVKDRQEKRSRKRRLVDLEFCTTYVSEKEIERARQASRDKKAARSQKINDRIVAKKAKEQTRLEFLWDKKLSKAGLKKTSNGEWKIGRSASMATGEALAELAAHKRQQRGHHVLVMKDHLEKSGWTVGGPSQDVWSKPNWEKSEGNCSRTLHQAYKIQLKLDAKESLV